MLNFHWVWLTTLLPRFCIVASMSSSTSIQHRRSIDRDFVEREQYLTRDSYSERVRQLYAPSSSVDIVALLQTWKGRGELGRSMVPTGKKEDVQRDGRAIHAEDMPILSQEAALQPTSAPPFTAALALASTPPSAPASTVVASLNLSLSTESPYQGQTRTELAASQSASAPVTSSDTSSAFAFPPGLLAVIILFVCLMLLVIILALCRIYGRKGSRISVASPLFHCDPTATGPEHHRNGAFAMTASKMQARDAVLRSDHIRPRVIQSASKTNPFRDGGSISETSTFSSLHADVPHPSPVRITVSAPQAPRSRVSRPYVPRPYHRPHPAYTADPESVLPLMAREGPASSSGIGAGIKGKGDRIGASVKGKGKENMRPAGHARKRRDTLSAISLNRPTRPFVSPNTEPPVPSKLGASLVSGISSSVLNVTLRNDQEDITSPLPSGSTAVEIGLAMLKDFSSPHVGLGLELHPKPSDLRPPSPSQGEDMAGRANPDASRIAAESMDAPTVHTIGEGMMPYPAESMSSGSKGLAYLASESARGLMLPDQIEERDITEDDLGLAAALAAYRAEIIKAGSEPRGDSPDSDLETRQAELGDRESLDDRIFSEPVLSGFKAPTLPTLSEMALSRADPLYESVTNELFASYGVRMSTGSGVGRMSRVSARISKMLSWFGDAGAKDGGLANRMSVMSSEGGVTDTEGPRTSGVIVGGVQPLRIGKLRRSPE